MKHKTKDVADPELDPTDHIPAEINVLTENIDPNALRFRIGF